MPAAETAAPGDSVIQGGGNSVPTQEVVINVENGNRAISNSTDQHSSSRMHASTTVPAPANATRGNAETNNRSIHKGNCCMKTRSCLESSKFSFILGGMFFLGGVMAIGFSSSLPGDLFLVGPFCVAAGAILVIRGCITTVAKRQQKRQMREREALFAHHHPGTRHPNRDRSRRNEEWALSQENLIIPPNYFDVVVAPKPATAPVGTGGDALHTSEHFNAGSQVNFDEPTAIHRETSKTTSGPGRPMLRQLSSVQSQTSFPHMVSIAVDTSDLPTQLDPILQSPPSYATVTHHRPDLQAIYSDQSLVTNQQESSLSMTNQQESSLSMANQQESSLSMANQQESSSSMTNQQESSLSMTNQESSPSSRAQTQSPSHVTYYLPTDEEETPDQSHSADL